MEQQPQQAQQGPQAGQVAREMSDEDKKMHDHIYGIAAKVLYSDEFLPKAEEIMKRSSNPVAGAATLVVTLGAKVLDVAQKAGQQIPGTALMSAGWAVMQEVRDFAAQFLDIELSEDQVKAAFFNAADQIGDMAKTSEVVSFDVTPEQQQAMMQDAGGEEGIAEQRRQARQMAMPQPQTKPAAKEQPKGLGARK